MADPTVVELANQMAEECLAVQRETGQERLFMEVAAVLGASSQTMEEAFVTAIRTGEAPSQTPRELRNLQRIQDAIYQSASTGREVRLDTEMPL